VGRHATPGLRPECGVNVSVAGLSVVAAGRGEALAGTANQRGTTNTYGEMSGAVSSRATYYGIANKQANRMMLRTSCQPTENQRSHQIVVCRFLTNQSIMVADITLRATMRQWYIDYPGGGRVAIR